MIEIKYQPYVGLLFEDKRVHTKIRNDNKLHFFQCLDEISYDDFKKETVDDLIAGIENVKYLGWVELKP